ncbi:ABC transporter permease subunit [Kineosporia mesophila]|uniref:ABC transporter permease subunit n=1 Tax=Kineosporia mesophila TaxID=566012 RepID=A0ABP6ZVB1_9ACTN|nr:ABC transporter permease [Kineosporia mesophila]MCD5349754.1 ABC transporter permease [Kineosporia mesophila]
MTGFARQFGIRLASMAGVLPVLTFVVEEIQRQLPSDPARVLAGRTASPQALAAARERLGLDEPLITHYVGYLGRLLSGDLGTSVSTRRPVADDIATYLPATLELVLVAALLALVGGLLLGVVGARDGLTGGLVRVVSVAGASAASFLLAIVLLLVFYRDLGWFPAGGRGDTADGPTGMTLLDSLLHGDPGGFLDAVRHVVLPAVVLALGPAVAIGRVLRASLREVMAADFVRSARAKGAGWWLTVWRHGLRNAAGPALSMAGLQVSIMFGGSVVVESLFSWPGLGRYLSTAIAASDLAAITGVVLVLGVAYVLLNFLVDTLQLLIDPRLRESE